MTKTGRNNETLARADIALRMGQLHEAEHLAASLLKGDKGNLPAAMIVARCLLAQGRSDEAIIALDHAVRRHGDPGARSLLASTLAAAGRREDALAHIEAVTAKGIPFAPAYREHASMLVALGRIDEAVAIAERGAAICHNAIELQLDLAALHLRRNDRTAARHVLAQAREAAPGRADVIAELARVLMLEGDYAAAADACRHALALQPDNAMTRANLAACQLELGQREAGEASLRAATQGRPQMVSRAIHALAASSHGRFFIKPSDVARFLAGKRD